MRNKGFTLIELLVAITILAIVSAIGLSSYSQAQVVGRDAKRKQDLRSLATALELFYRDNKRYPCSGSTWTDSSKANWLTDSTTSGCGGTGNNLAPTYINKMPMDPKSNTGNSYNTIGYGYFSPYGSYGSGPSACPQGQYYILSTVLENSNDKENIATNNAFCGQTLSIGGGAFSPSAYILHMP
jgi:prepilin-type N-terminal cleavage/methylation domain-containing protein